MKPDKLQFNLQRAEDTKQLGCVLANLVNKKGVISLVGPLGAGKTTFAQGVAFGLKIDEPVNSPTFTMLNEYHSGRIPFYHLDLYRLLPESDSICPQEKDLSMLFFELDELMAGPGLTLIEWADCLPSYVNQLDHVMVELAYVKQVEQVFVTNDSVQESARTANIAAYGNLSSQVVEKLRDVYFS